MQGEQRASRCPLLRGRCGRRAAITAATTAAALDAALAATAAIGAALAATAASATARKLHECVCGQPKLRPRRHVRRWRRWLTLRPLRVRHRLRRLRRPQADATLAAALSAVSAAAALALAAAIATDPPPEPPRAPGGAGARSERRSDLRGHLHPARTHADQSQDERLCRDAYRRLAAVAELRAAIGITLPPRAPRAGWRRARFVRELVYGGAHAGAAEPSLVWLRASPQRQQR